MSNIVIVKIILPTSVLSPYLYNFLSKINHSRLRYFKKNLIFLQPHLSHIIGFRKNDKRPYNYKQTCIKRKPKRLTKFSISSIISNNFIFHYRMMVYKYCLALPWQALSSTLRTPHKNLTYISITCYTSRMSSF